MDPLAEKYPAWSPYNYVMNNPLGMVDPDGKETAPPGDYYDVKGNYKRSDGNNDGKVYIDTQAGGVVTTDVQTVVALSIVAYGETTPNATWEQRTGIAESVVNRSQASGRTVLAHATNANEYKGIVNARGTEMTTALEGYTGGSDIGAGKTANQVTSIRSALNALRGTGITNGATGFDGYGDLERDRKNVVEKGKDPIDKGALRRGKGYDRPFRGMDASGIVDPQFAIGSTQNIESPGSPQTYILTKVVWDNKKAGVSGTVFYKTNPASGARY